MHQRRSRTGIERGCRVMAKYFKVIEISEEEFIDIAGEDLDCSQLVIPVGKKVFVAVDENSEYEINIPLDLFE